MLVLGPVDQNTNATKEGSSMKACVYCTGAVCKVVDELVKTR